MDFRFKGLLTPVFTPFKDDKFRTINYDVIDKYGYHLKNRGIEGVVVNGWTGEGMTLTIDERKRVAEEWVKVGTKYSFKVFLVLGGTTLAELYNLAEHAEKIKVDAVLVYPDNYYRKYMTEDDLVKYLKDFYLRMPTRPFFYLYRKDYIKRRLDMFDFLDTIEREINTFSGIYYDHNVKSDEILLLKSYKPHKIHIIDTKLTLISPFFEGFDVLSMTFGNLYPELLFKLYDGLKNKRYDDVYQVKDKLTRYFIDYSRDTTYQHLHPTIIFKTEFNKKYPDIFLGPVRMPRMTMRHSYF